MASDATSPWARIDTRADGVFLTVRPGAPAAELAVVITQLLERRIAGVDFDAVQAAWRESSGAPVLIAPPPETKSEATSAFESHLRTAERDGEAFLTIAPSAPRLRERELIAWLNQRDYSGVDLELVRIALRGPRGVQYQITRAGMIAPRVVVPGLEDARSVLVVEVDEAHRNRIAESLQRRGLSVRTARNSDAAIFEVRQRPIDLVLLAHPLGREDGLRLCQRLRAEPRAEGLAVLVVCVLPTREFVRKALESGANDILVRPWPPGALFHKMDSALRRVGKRLAASAAAGAAKDAELLSPGEEMKTLGRIDLSKLCATVTRLHALPGVVERVLQLTSDPDSGASELATCIESDPAVTAVVLRMANSTLYGASGKVEHAAEAIVRIGFLQTKSLVVGMSVIRNFAKGTKSAGFDRVLFWRHSISTAILAKQIADVAKLPSSEVVFVAGLLHDVGKVLLDEFVPMDFSQAVMSAIQERVPLIGVEARILQTTHAEVGQTVLTAWKFPQVVVSAVRQHHAPVGDEEGMEPGLRKMCDIVHVANVLAKANGHGHGGDLAIAEVPEAVWLRLGLRTGLPERFWKTMRVEVERFEQLLGLEVEETPAPGPSEPVAVLCDARPPCVSVLQVALESAGWRVVRANAPSEVAAAPSVAVSRCASADAVVAACKLWTAAFPTARLIGVLPRGVAPPPGYVCLVEPYDRSALVSLLPSTVTPGDAASPA